VRALIQEVYRDESLRKQFQLHRIGTAWRYGGMARLGVQQAVVGWTIWQAVTGRKGGGAAIFIISGGHC
jgi:hypothetical protein